jgi:large subunit ribosomal protein L21
MEAAVIATGGKQYRVTQGQVISVEKLAGSPGDAVAFTSVVLVTRDDEVISGTDRLRSAKVSGEVVAQGRGKKVQVVKFKRRKNYRPRSASPTSRCRARWRTRKVSAARETVATRIPRCSGSSVSPASS